MSVIRRVAQASLLVARWIVVVLAVVAWLLVVPVIALVGAGIAHVRRLLESADGS